jgi:hypothetical protein
MSQYQYSKLPNALVKKYYLPKTVDTKGFYDLTKSLPRNYNTNAKIDYTAIIQKALDEHDKVVMPNFPLLINKSGLFLKSNKTVYFPANAWLKFQGPAKTKLDDVLKIYNAENVILINPKIEGSKYSPLSQDGQWSAGICLLNSKNIQIQNLKITNTYGDGLFIGSEDGGFCENIKIIGGWIDNARRNGLSITSGRDIFVEKLLISNTSEHEPEAGVDIEPSWYKDIMENVNLKNIYTYNNKQAGISVNMNALNVASNSEAKKISVTIDGHTDQGSNHAFLTSFNQSEGSNKYDATGNVVVKNSNWIKSRNQNFWTTPENHRINLEFKNIKIDDSAKSKAFKESVQTKQGILLQ